MLWTEATRSETRYILKKIRPLNWVNFADLSRAEDRYKAPLYANRYDHVPDQTDRKSLALAESADAANVY
jgi:hypothetical protein